MGSVIRFAAVNTKVKALEGKFLTEEQYIRLMEKKTYQEAVRYIREETHYSSMFSNLYNDEIHRRQFELMLKKNYTKNFQKISRYFNGSYKKLINILYLRFVIEDLKIILRCKYIGRKNEEIYPLLCADGPQNPFNYRKLVESRGLQDFVENLNGTAFYKYLQPLVGKSDDEGLFRMETAMDFVYFSSLRKIEHKIDAEDKKILSEMTGTYCDLLNLQWIIRGKLYYKLSPEVLFNYIIYDGHRLHAEDAKRICYARDENEILEYINKLPYKTVFNETQILSEMTERNILAYLRKYFSSHKTLNKMNIASVAAYLELSYLELRDIISVMENIRYGAGEEEAKKFITFTI